MAEHLPRAPLSIGALLLLVMLAIGAAIAFAGCIGVLYLWGYDAWFGRIEVVESQMIGVAHPGGRVWIKRTYLAPYTSTCTVGRWLGDGELRALIPVVEVFEETAVPKTLYFELNIPADMKPGPHTYMTTFACQLNAINRVTIQLPAIKFDVIGE